MTLQYLVFGPYIIFCSPYIIFQELGPPISSYIKAYSSERQDIILYAYPYHQKQIFTKLR